MFSSNTSQVAATATQPEAIDFDGTNDYLIRSTDLTGNTDSSTFTFSVWVWSDVSGLSYIYTTDNTSDSRVQTWISTTQVGLYMKNSAGTVILNASATVPNNNPPKNTWIHILWSINLASTSNRSCYINDVLQSTVSWDTYTNGSIDFTQPNHNIAGGPVLGGYTKARLSNVYLDKTYRDMSVTANRRLFVTADLKPAAGQAALNPILYLPMSDPTQPGLNAGTGGNFTLTGTVARSGRGPNQYNAPYSDLDGTSDYVNRIEAIVGITNGTLLTVSFCMNLDTVSSGYLWEINGPDGDRPVRMYLETNGQITFQGFSGITQILNGTTAGTPFVAGRNYVITASVDMSNEAKRHFYVNGQAVSMSWGTYLNSSLTLTSQFVAIGGAAGGGGRVNGRMGAFWLNNSYADLSVQATREKFVTGTGINAAPVDPGATGELPTGTSPKVYLPMYGNSAGLNKGTGGNFTVNSGPYAGARGPNEFWGNFDSVVGGSNNFTFKSSALTGITNTNKFSFVAWFNRTNSGTRPFFTMADTSGTVFKRIAISFDGSNRLDIRARDSSTTFLQAVTANSYGTGTRFCVMMSFDLSDTAKRSVYVNSVVESVTYTTYTNGTITFTEATRLGIGTSFDSGAYAEASSYGGLLGEFYFVNDYIDFTQEANRLKFRDAFGNPVNLTQQIEGAAIPTPQIYMRFAPGAVGTNSGTGGNFTANGTHTDGGQF